MDHVLEERIAELEADVLAKEELIVHLTCEKRQLRAYAQRLELQSKGQEEKVEERYLDHEVQQLQQQCTRQADEINRLERIVRVKEERIEEYVARMSQLEDELEKIKMIKENDKKEEDNKQDKFEWQEEMTRYPTPHFSIDSPEVNYLLKQWTQNQEKIQALMHWFKEISQETISNDIKLPSAIELPRLSCELRDGFLTLIVPLLRKQLVRSIQVHTRVHDQEHTDVRIRVYAKI
ncbi:hypothetical protein THRCLA_01654 [Thraustotheca clavata]|uniref:Uncharacterized protein n=1 Tax=Thraustotheca clavata TaxID=74557 RepID=A0A1W0A7N4_9STRA|nr:hypothetical protein THRCLA_01654 [Thraustotheca clavata]